jgi:hypothetical protein
VGMRFDQSRQRDRSGFVGRFKGVLCLISPPLPVLRWFWSLFSSLLLVDRSGRRVVSERRWVPCADLVDSSAWVMGFRTNR